MELVDDFIKKIVQPQRQTLEIVGDFALNTFEVFEDFAFFVFDVLSFFNVLKLFFFFFGTLKNGKIVDMFLFLH